MIGHLYFNGFIDLVDITLQFLLDTLGFDVVRIFQKPLIELVCPRVTQALKIVLIGPLILKRDFFLDHRSHPRPL